MIKSAPIGFYTIKTLAELRKGCEKAAARMSRMIEQIWVMKTCSGFQKIELVNQI